MKLFLFEKTILIILMFIMIVNESKWAFNLFVISLDLNPLIDQHDFYLLNI